MGNENRGPNHIDRAVFADILAHGEPRNTVQGEHAGRPGYRVFAIVVTCDGAPVEVSVEALDVDSAKRAAVAHCQRLGYERVNLGFPKRRRT